MLTEALTNLNSAFIKTKVRMDEISSEISKTYSKNEILSSLSLPFYSISEVTIRLNFAIQGMINDDLSVLIDSASLEKLPQNTLSQIEFKLIPKKLRTFKQENGAIIYSPES